VKFCRRAAAGRRFQVPFLVIFYFHFFQDGQRKLYKTKLSWFLLILKYYLANEIKALMVRWTCGTHEGWYLNATISPEKVEVRNHVGLLGSIMG